MDTRSDLDALEFSSKVLRKPLLNTSTVAKKPARKSTLRKYMHAAHNVDLTLLKAEYGIGARMDGTADSVVQHTRKQARIGNSSSTDDSQTNSDSSLEHPREHALDDNGDPVDDLDSDERMEKGVLRERFFANLRIKTSATSNNTLSLLPVLSGKTYLDSLVSQPQKHGSEICRLNDTYCRYFPQWLFELEQGFNIVLYGYGSKRELIDAVKFESDASLLAGLWRTILV